VELAAAWMRGEDAVPTKESLYGTDFDESGLLPVIQPEIGNRKSGIDE